MKLISCHIENFGRLRAFDHTFADGLNVILRENGWGKSTFAAFLCAMFYGLPASRKRKTGDNDRERYRPWQGGAYGGSLLFETGGKTYEMTRLFGKKESDDVFELRDADTNLPDFGFSSKIGEELFHLDRESFLRTAFTAQQDCATAPTDDVNALLADLAEQTGDMGGYEDAMRRLTESMGRLAPDRRTGQLYRRGEEIRQLEQQARGERELADRLDRCAARHREEAERERDLARRLRELEGALDRAVRAAEERAKEAEEARARAVDREILQRLRAAEEDRQREALRAAQAFPGRIPSREEIEDQLARCRTLERLEYALQEGMLSEEEQQRLTELEKYFQEEKGDKCAPPHSAAARYAGLHAKNVLVRGENIHARNVPVRGEKGGGKDAALRASFAPLFLAAGILLMIVGIAAALLTGRPAAAVLLAGGLSAAFSLILALPRLAGEPADLREREFVSLRRKEQKLESIHAQWAEARRPVDAFLRELGLTIREDEASGEALWSRLEEIRDAADDYEDAQALLRQAAQERRAFEAQTKHFKEEDGLAADKNTSPPKEMAGEAGTRQMRDTNKTGAANLNRAQEDVRLSGTENVGGTQEDARFSASEIRKLRREAEACRKELQACRAALAEETTLLGELQEEQAEKEEDRMRLRELRARQEDDMASYRHLAAAAGHLQKAREAVASRYTDPVRQSFARYWEMAAASSAAGIYLDANAQVTVEEQGKQRELSLFSTGCRDLAGICLRLAFADAMYPAGRPGRPPLILDDPFVSLDDERAVGAMRLLQAASARFQILYFTCSRSRSGAGRAAG